jgi:hypothetical protein
MAVLAAATSITVYVVRYDCRVDKCATYVKVCVGEVRRTRRASSTFLVYVRRHDSTDFPPQHAEAFDLARLYSRQLMREVQCGGALYYGQAQGEIICIVPCRTLDEFSNLLLALQPLRGKRKKRNYRSAALATSTKSNC